MWVAATAMALSACSPDAEPTPVETAEHRTPLEERSGLLLAETRGDSLGVHAQFLDLDGITTDAALDAIAVWSPDHELNRDACSLREFERPGPNRKFSVEMLDVGPIEIEFADERIRLEGRRLPELVGGISGVVYGSEQGFDVEASEITYFPERDYRFSAPGGSSAGGFDVEAPAPVVPEIALLAGQPITAHESISLDTGRDLDIEWTVPASGLGSDVYLDLQSSGGTGPRLSCRLEDDGFFTLPAGAIRALSRTNSKLDVTLRRVQIVNVEVDGLDEAEIVLSAADDAFLWVEH